MTSAKEDVRPRGLLSWGRTRTIPLVLMVFGLAACVVVIAFYYQAGDNGDRRLNRYFLTDCDTCSCDDIAIIGAGVSGTYAAWRLRNRNLSISVYEYSDRIGGRLHTIQFPGIPDVNVELGGMRFIPPAHPLITRTAAALGLSVVDFRPGLGFEEDALFYLRGTHIRRRDLGDPATSPYNMKPREQGLSPNQLKSELFVNYTTFNVGDTLNDTSVLYSKTPDGTPLYAQSVSVATSAMGASHEALDYLRDTEGYHFRYEGLASEVFPVVARTPEEILTVPVKTIGEGMQALPERLARGFLDASSSHALLYNQELSQIEKQPDSTYKLTFWPTITIGEQTRRKQGGVAVTKCAKKVILSVPRRALDAIDWAGLRDPEVSRNVQRSIMDIPAAKVFLAFDQPWWKNLPFTFSHSVSDLPNRQTYDFGTSNQTKKAVLLAAYVDMEDVKFWRETQARGADAGNAAPSGLELSSESIFHATRFLADIFNISASDIPKPLGGAISLWDEFPFGGGWQVWMPGFDWSEISKKMLKPSAADDVYLSTNGFSPAYGSTWVEYALEQADLVIDRMDKA